MESLFLTSSCHAKKVHKTHTHTHTIYLSIFAHAACEILVPQPGMESPLLALDMQSLNHWTAKEVSWNSFFKGLNPLLSDILQLSAFYTALLVFVNRLNELVGMRFWVVFQSLWPLKFLWQDTLDHKSPGSTYFILTSIPSRLWFCD